MSRIYLYSLNSIIMWLNVKKYFENGVANIQNAWKRAFATLATVAALSGTLTSCNSPEVKASGDAVTAGFEYVHSNGSAEPTRYQYNVEIRKVGDIFLQFPQKECFQLSVWKVRKCYSIRGSCH